MPKLAITVEHSLGVEEAVRRIKEKQELMIAGGETEATDVEIEWNGNGSEMSFKFQSFGAKVSGTVIVTDTDVKVSLAIPLLAIPFKSQIVKRVEKELREVLS